MQINNKNFLFDYSGKSPAFFIKNKEDLRSPCITSSLMSKEKETTSFDEFSSNYLFVSVSLFDSFLYVLE